MAHETGKWERFQKIGLSSVRIGITYNLKSDFDELSTVSFPEDAFEEWDQPETIEAIQKVFEGAGHEVHLLGGDLGIIDQIKRFKIEFVFNLAEGFSGRNRESHIPAILDMLNIPYSGSDALALAATLDKSIAKRLAISLGIPTPDFWVLNDESDLSRIPNQFPLFVKPLWEGSSKGIRLSSRVKDMNALKKEFHRLGKYDQAPVLVESFISGQEITAGIIGNPPKILGLMEIVFEDPNKFYSVEAKRDWKQEVNYQVPPKVKDQTLKQIEASSLKLFEVLGLKDVARFDFRIDSKGTAYFLEANPLPGLSPESGDLVILASKKGLAYHQLILKIFKEALQRYPLINSIK